MPLEICRVAVEVCRLSKVAAGLGNPQAVTDAGIGAILGEAAVVGAALNVRINLGSIKDAAYVEAAAIRDRRHPGRGGGAARRGPRPHALQALIIT